MVGNPNHDPRSGRFTSKSGLNKNNSTIGQRGKAKVKEHISAAKAAAIGIGVTAAGAVGAALLQGITRPVRVHGAIVSDKVVSAARAHAEQFVANQGPKIAHAIATKGSTLVNHVKNMKIAGKSQHNVSSISSKSSMYKSPSQLKAEMAAIRSPKPRVRVPMRRK